MHQHGQQEPRGVRGSTLEQGLQADRGDGIGRFECPLDVLQGDPFIAEEAPAGVLGDAQVDAL